MTSNAQETEASEATDEGLWTPEVVSDYLIISIGTLYAWRKRGVGPQAIKVGKHLRYRPDDVRAWLRSRTR